MVHDWNKPLAIEFNTLGGGHSNESNRGGPLRVFAGPTRSYFRAGDTDGMAADMAGIFHPFWIDNRTGVPQVWTANVTVSGAAVRNGAPDLQDLADVTQNVTFEFANPHYDPVTKIVLGEAYLVNTSHDVLTGPIKVRVLLFDIGTVEVLNADNHEKNKGAVWDFTAQLSDNKLKPGERTKGKLLQFRVLDIQEPTLARQRFAGFQVKVLGKLARAAN